MQKPDLLPCTLSHRLAHYEEVVVPPLGGAITVSHTATFGLQTHLLVKRISASVCLYTVRGTLIKANNFTCHAPSVQLKNQWFKSSLGPSVSHRQTACSDFLLNRPYFKITSTMYIHDASGKQVRIALEFFRL